MTARITKGGRIRLARKKPTKKASSSSAPSVGKRAQNLERLIAAEEQRRRQSLPRKNKQQVAAYEERVKREGNKLAPRRRTRRMKKDID